jgi:hypothetical protein
MEEVREHLRDPEAFHYWQNKKTGKRLTELCGKYKKTQGIPAPGFETEAICRKKRHQWLGYL